MPDRILLTDDSLNSYGFRVLSSGAKLDRFLKNPVMLDTHSTWNLEDVIGKWKDIRRDENGLSAEPDFDMGDERAAALGGKYERGFLQAASIGFRILGTSEDPEDMLEGQTLPTVTKWELLEASLVPIGANGNAVRLYDQKGNKINLDEPEAVSLAFQKQAMKDETKNPELNEQAIEGLVHKALRKLGLIKSDPSPQDPKPEVEAGPTPEPEATPSELALQAKVDAAQAMSQKLTTDNQSLRNTIAELRAEIKRLAAAPADDPADVDPPHDPGAKPQGTDRFLSEADKRVRAKYGPKKK